MATYNKMAILLKAHQYASTAKVSTIGKHTPYRVHLAEGLRKQWHSAKLEAVPTKKYIIKLEFSEGRLREEVKKLGGKWDADSKTWTLVAKAWWMSAALTAKIYRAADRVAPAKAASVLATNSNAGYAGAVQYPAKRRYNDLTGPGGIRYGAEYDGIE